MKTSLSMSNSFGCWGSRFIWFYNHVECILNKIFTNGIFNWYLFLGIALVQWNEIVLKIYWKITWIEVIHNVAVLEIKLRCWKDGKVLNKLRLLYWKTLLGKLEQCVSSLGKHCLDYSPVSSLILHFSHIYDPRSTIHDPRSTIHDPRSTIQYPRFTIHNPLFDPRSTIHNL